MLTRACAIDQIGEQLILGAADGIEPGKAGREAVSLSRSTESAELINRMLASGRPEAASILRPPSASARRSVRENRDRIAANRNPCRTPEAKAKP
jgi:hypothetical protein